MSYKEQLRVFKPFSKLRIKRLENSQFLINYLRKSMLYQDFTYFFLKLQLKTLSRIKNIPQILLEVKKVTQ